MTRIILLLVLAGTLLAIPARAEDAPVKQPIMAAG